MLTSAPFVQQRRLSDSGSALGPVKASPQYPQQKYTLIKSLHAHPQTPLSLAWAPEKTFSFFPAKNGYRGEAK